MRLWVSSWVPRNLRSGRDSRMERSVRQVWHGYDHHGRYLGRGFGKEMGRLLKKGRKNDPKSRVVPMEKMLKSYYRIRSYDDSGKPTSKIMKNLSIEIR